MHPTPKSWWTYICQAVGLLNGLEWVIQLEALKGDRKGQWSVRISRQWRVCFRFEAGNAFDVEITDYH